MPQVLRELPNDTAELTEAFSVFNSLSAQLTEAYSQLESQVARLNTELTESRRQRAQDLAQKDRLADRLGKLLEVLPAAVVLVDGRDRVDRFNPAAQALFPSLAWGRRWTEIKSEQVEAELGSGDWLLAGGLRVTVSRRPLSDRGEILVMVDVTEQKRLQEHLERRDRLAAMGEMAAQLAHQVRTPLSTATLYAGQLAKDGLTSEQRRQFADKLMAGLSHTGNLVSDMLSFSRGGSYRPVFVPLRDLLLTAVDAVGPRLRSQTINLDLDIRLSEDAGVLGNRDALAGAIVNLLDNAVQTVPENLHLVLRSDLQEGRVRIVVEDNGPGIGADVQARIFDPFFTTRPRGTGLGLAVVQAVVLEHDGTITAGRSASLGGAQFEITLPPAVLPGEAGSHEQ